MIAVDRSTGPRPNDAWFDTATTSTRDAVREGHRHVVDDAVYAHAQVRMALEDLFLGKCAYCESATTATAAWDVEHFRPKGRVAERPAHTGYYWLTYTWENLYLACQFCNQRRRDQPTTDEPTLGAALGKLDQFPLAIERTRVMTPRGKLTRERRLLLDPCADDPQKHITFGLKGQALPVAASLRGETTIRVCNLDRKRLRRERRIHVELVLSQVQRFRARTSLMNVLTDLRDTLGAPGQPYRAVVYAICDDPIAFGLN